MNPFADRNSTERFTALAEDYDRCRPDYPLSLWQFLCEYAAIQPPARIADIGCGTGIATRQLASMGYDIVGIEPNAAMRQFAIARVPVGSRSPEYRDGTDAHSGLPANSVEMVIAAQAFHWFSAEGALQEFHRILKPGGCAALIWNNCDERDPFTNSYVTALRMASAEKTVADASQSATGEVLLQHPLFVEGVRREFPHSQLLDRDGLRGRAFSVSFGPRDAAGRDRFATLLNGLFECHQHNGVIEMRYHSVLLAAKARRL
jgi:SAM-dependent methyltransferase